MAKYTSFVLILERFDNFCDYSEAKKMDRKFFANFRFVTSQDFSRYSSLPIFTIKEIQGEPLKWLKYLLLARLGLTSVERLQTQIKRYEISELDRACSDCKLITEQASTLNKDFMIVLKAIPRDTTGMIRNFRLYSNKDVHKTFEEISELYSQSDRQLWFCLSDIHVGSLSLGGRLTLPRYDTPDAIELVWYTSPRRIEEYSGSQFPFPFWRAHRNQAELSFQSDILHIPSQYANQSPKSYLEEGQFVIQQIMLHRTSIECLCNVLYLAGASEVAIEFKFEAGSLSFIDWDTDKESVN